MSNSYGPKKKAVRPLGAVRQPVQASYDRTSHFPKYSVDKFQINSHYELHGSAMQVPPPKEEKEKEEIKPVKVTTSHAVRSAKSDSGSSTKSQPPVHVPDNSVDKKELIEAKAKIKDLKQQIAALEKENAELKEKVQVRDKIVAELKEEHAKQEEYYKKLYETEKTLHMGTQEKFEASAAEVRDLKKRLEEVQQEAEEKLKKTQTEFEQKIAELTEEKDKEIAERDAKMNRLKLQMAEALKGNSWERQQQLEELTKELGRLQDEADSLRGKLKAFKNSKTCSNCAESALRLEKAVAAMKEKDGTIKELKSLCSRFEKQLTQQDEILKMFAEKKGHKVPGYPK